MNLKDTSLNLVVDISEFMKQFEELLFKERHLIERPYPLHRSDAVEDYRKACKWDKRKGIRCISIQKGGKVNA